MRAQGHHRPFRAGNATVVFLQVVLKKLLKQRRLQYKATRLLFCTPQASFRVCSTPLKLRISPVSRCA